MDVVDFSKVRKKLEKLPHYIKIKAISWAMAVELEGIVEIRKRPGYHDGPLVGNRKGQRSIRLSRSYRLIYRESNNGIVKIIIIQEVNKHDY